MSDIEAYSFFFVHKEWIRLQKTPIPESEIEKLVEDINDFKERYDYSFSDIFRYRDNKIEIGIPFLNINTDETLNKIKEYHNLFESVRQTWKSKEN